MATITTDTYLDGGTARTAGELWTLNGATLTVRTDTRWHANAPAAMTGTLGAITGSDSLGAGLFVDGTKVRWMAYDTGSGNVPAIGTTITQGGVSGYLLGVWADYTSAPTAVGAAMPATGYIKFREVTGGTYSAGALSGIGASATGADVPGWIEFVIDTGSAWTFYKAGLGIKFDGQWFEIGTTNGSAGQTMQVPTNGGGANTSVVAVQVETSAGSGQYEWWPCASTTSGFTTTYLSTDTRSKVCQSVGNGQIRFGSDGTNNIGYVPASGCKVRVPNIFGRHAATGTRATNAASSTIPSGIGSSMSSGGTKVQISYLLSDSYQIQPDNASSITIFNSAINQIIASNASSFTFTNSCIGRTVNLTSAGIWLIACPSVSITESKIYRFNGGASTPTNASSAGIFLNSCSNISIQNNKIIQSYLGSSVSCIGLSVCSNAVIDSIQAIGYGITVDNSSNINISNFDYTYATRGSTGYAITMALRCQYSNTVNFSNLTLGNYGEYTNIHPQNYIVYTIGNKSKIRISNIGTYESPLAIGASNTTSSLHYSGGANDNDVKFNKVYISTVAGNPIYSQTISTSNMQYENVYVNSVAANQKLQMSGAKIKSSKMPFIEAGIAYTDSPVTDTFISTTLGEIALRFSAPTSATIGDWEFNFTDPQSGFTGYGDLAMKQSGEYAIYTMNYYAKGLTGFSGSQTLSTRLTSTNLTATYQYDIGAGWNGSWLTAAQMASVTVDPQVGVKIKFKIALGASGTVRTVNKLSLATTTTQEAQTDYIYPLSTATLGFTGLQVGSEVRVYAGTDPATSVEIGGIESTSGSTFSFSHSYGGTDGYIMIFALGYQPLYIPYTFKSVDDSILIQQVIDRNYTNPA